MKSKKFVINDENVREYVEKIGTWIREKVKKAGADGVVLGMSGGVDSSTVARLCQEANVKVHLILMPYGKSMDKKPGYNNAQELIDKFNFEYHIFDIKPATDALKIEDDSKNSKLAEANIKPRIRMVYLYQYAQIHNLLVIGTGNLSEGTVGYFTKWGDGACDINPLSNITKREVYVLAKYLKVPDNIINKKPSADLWEGQTDEGELGITYEQIDEFILNGTSGDKQIDKKIQEKNEKSKHKLEEIMTFKN